MCLHKYRISRDCRNLHNVLMADGHLRTGSMDEAPIQQLQHPVRSLFGARAVPELINMSLGKKQLEAIENEIRNQVTSSGFTTQIVEALKPTLIEILKPIVKETINQILAESLQPITDYLDSIQTPSRTVGEIFERSSTRGG